MNKQCYFGFDDKEDIAKQFAEGWSNTGLEAKAKILAELEDATVLFAAYEGGGYEGDATVIYQKNGKLFEVYGSHCSCYGLEGQWEPEEGSVKELKTRPGLSDYAYSKETRDAFDDMRASLRGAKS